MVSGMKPVFCLDSRVKCLRQSTIVSINNFWKDSGNDSYTKQSNCASAK